MEPELFREIEHTGDVGIEVEADTRSELFRRAALAVIQLMADTGQVRARESREVWVAGTADTDLMHDMLSALMRLFMLEGFIWCAAAVTEAAAGLQLRLEGERFDAQRHEFYRELKAVTYHELWVGNDRGRWRARIIFDV